MCLVFFIDFFFQFIHLEQLFLLFSFLFVIVFLMSRFWWYNTASNVHHKLIYDISLTSVISISRLTQVQFHHIKMWSLISRQWLEKCQFSSVAQSYPAVCNPMNCSMPGSPVHHQFPEPTQTHVHRVGGAIQPSHLPSSPSPPIVNLSQYQGLFQWVLSTHQVAKVLELPLQHQSFQWIFRTDLL